MAVHFSSKSVEWNTPQYIYDDLNAVFEFGLDAAATKENTKHKNFISPEEDAFKHRWVNRSRGAPTFINPPYSREKPTLLNWVEKIADEGGFGTVVALLPARTDTKFFHDYCCKYGINYLLQGRIKFEKADGGEKTNSAPFPSLITIFAPEICETSGLSNPVIIPVTQVELRETFSGWLKYCEAYYG